ncbi:hypothetical protein OSTOST_01502 [Ostertagia ostertagi]
MQRLGSFLYGSVGHVIAHEISHSLDSMGKEYDGNGDKRKWWEDEWVEEYESRADCYVDQYDSVKLVLASFILEALVFRCGASDCTRNLTCLAHAGMELL